MSLKNAMILMLALVLIFSLLPLEAAAQETTGATEPTTEAPAEQKQEIPWAITALVLALITTFPQNKFIHGRR